ncbi:MAG: hypothetical protein NXY57DRAFT_138851 [Lentinula lateritia]|uniref:F-box domain-containing protein n=1 Tax=Lentinula lateritia TaxID=40482 RepID=A0ABQ8VK97_9AGAR|nr:MAG: hypothetical protein NXY57DRAFT_138851 [Lentinula lateritia]KAJ4496821.1 hypothetical protein C8R41DRAFT_865956 [Lentinula lateritia]
MSLKPSSRNRKQVVGGWQFDALDETRPGRVMPELPRELWIEILAMASCQYLGKASGLVGSGGKYDSLPRTANGRPLGAKSDILSFSLVSKAWNTYSQPALYHTINIRRSSQAKALAWTLLSQICGGPPPAQTLLIPSYSPQPMSYSASCSSVGSSSVTPSTGLETSGRHIRYLTLSTFSYDRCDPSDVLVILSSSPHLVGFCDEGGIRCPLLDDCCDWKATPEKLLGVLVAASAQDKEKGRKSRRESKRYSNGTISAPYSSNTARLECLTWTCYPHLPLPLPIPFSPSGEFTGFNLLRSLHLYLPYNDGMESFSFPEYPELDGSINTKYQPPLHLPSLTKLTLTLSDPILSKSHKGSTGYTYSTPPNTLLALLAEWDLPSLRILTINTPYTLHHSSDGRGQNPQQHHDANDAADERLGYKLGDGFWRFFKSHGSRIVVLEFGRISAGSQISPRQTLSPLSRLASRASHIAREGYVEGSEAPGYGYEHSYIRDVQEMEDRWIEAQVRDANREQVEAERLAEAEREREEFESWTKPFPPSPEAAAASSPMSSSFSSMSASSQNLASLTPNLRTFICSASLSSSHDQDLTFNGLDAFDDAADAFDALEWDWTHPDWVAPHPLLPSHPNVRMIGIREIGERVRADWDEREEGVIWDQSELGSENGMGDHNNPFFMLYLQLSSLLLPSVDDAEHPDEVQGSSIRRERQKVPFPSLKYIRDLDPDSDLLRRGVRHLERTSIPSVMGPMQGAGSPVMSQAHARRWSWRRPSLLSLPSFLPSPSYASQFSNIISARNSSRPPHFNLYSVQTQTRSRHQNASDASHSALLTLWSRVLFATRGGEVWLEDWRGWNLTKNNLERWKRC